MNINIDIDAAIDFLEKNTGLTPYAETKNKGKPCQIIWKGKVMKFYNGKTVWPSVGAAKCAFRQKFNVNRLIDKCCSNVPNEFIANAGLYGSSGTYYKSDFQEEIYQRVMHELQVSGILEFKLIS